MAQWNSGGSNKQRYSQTSRHFSRNRYQPFQTQWYVSEEYLKSYAYGNFHYYYGYRNQGVDDVRLTCMKKEWLTDKAVLDIGCNAGHLTLAIARDFSPKVIIGIDIDRYLIRAAKKNVLYYMDDDAKYSASTLPIGCMAKYGPFAASILPENEECVVKFPYNISFVQANYVVDSKELLADQQPVFDCILCLSITKWVHLNWGDEGLQRMFLRIFKHLRPGGFLVLEAQPFASYRRKKRLTEVTYHHFKSIKLFPDQFNEYLLKVIGFESCKLIDTPAHSSKGFSRPIYLFTKASASIMPKHIFHLAKEKSSSSEDLSDLSNCEELSD